MNKLIRILCLFLLIIFTGTINLNSQNSIFLKEKSGNNTSVPVNNIVRITFSAGNLNVYQADQNTISYYLNNISVLSFDSPTENKVIAENNYFAGLQLFPNPASESIQLRFNEITEGNLLIEIVNIQGKVLSQQYVSNQSGSNILSISTSWLQPGLYLLRIQNDKQTKSIKFYKE